MVMGGMDECEGEEERSDKRREKNEILMRESAIMIGMPDTHV